MLLKVIWIRDTKTLLRVRLIINLKIPKLIWINIKLTFPIYSLISRNKTLEAKQLLDERIQLFQSLISKPFRTLC